jgi:hypothetical protein
MGEFQAPSASSQVGHDRAKALVITQNSPWGMVTYNSFTKER